MVEIVYFSAEDVLLMRLEYPEQVLHFLGVLYLLFYKLIDSYLVEHVHHEDKTTVSTGLVFYILHIQNYFRVKFH